HAMAHQIGAQFKVPHGLANLMLLPHVIEANCCNPKALDKYSALSIKLGLSFAGLPKRTAVSGLCSAIEQLSKSLDCPTNLSEFGVESGEVMGKMNKMVENAKNDQTYFTNPVAFSTKELREI